MRRLAVVPKSRDEWLDMTEHADVHGLIDEVFPKYDFVRAAAEWLMNRFAWEPQPLTYERYEARERLKWDFLSEMIRADIVESAK